MNNSIIITGATGFVGKNLKQYLFKNFEINEVSIRYRKNQSFEFKSKSIIHLAGIAHDLKGNYKYDDYHKSNFELTKQVFDSFLLSNAEKFIFLSSVKAVSDSVKNELVESTNPEPKTYYGKTKLLAEKYILSKKLPQNKKVYILRPCMIHGPHNKGNLNLLFKLCKSGIPWPLGLYENERSYCFIMNFCFVINKLLISKNIISGVYNISDDKTISTNALIILIFKILNKKSRIIKVPKIIINIFVLFGNLFKLPFNSESLKKLTESYRVSNKKIKENLSIKKMPVSLEDGLRITLNNFKKL